MGIDQKLREWLDKQRGWFIGGSQAVKATWKPVSSDVDIIVLVNDYTAADTLPQEYVRTHNDDYTALQPNILHRAPGIDLIITERYDAFVLWHKATEVCKALNLTSRDDRVKVHHILLEREKSYELPVTTGDDWSNVLSF